MTVGQNIKKYRKALNLTQEELAQKVGVIQSNVYRWENDVVSPSIETLKKLAVTLNVSVDGLLFTNEERQQLNISDKELLERLKEIENLDPEDKKAVIRIIDSFRAKKD